MNVKFFYAVLVATVMFACNDDDENSRPPNDYNWTETKQPEEIIQDDLSSSGNWQYENGEVGEGSLTLISTGNSRAAAYNTLVMDYTRDWQVETTIIPANSVGTVRLHWESDAFNESFYEIKFDIAEQSVVIQRTGSSPVFGPPTAPQSVDTENGTPILITIRKVAGKIYIFVDKRLVLTRDHEIGYGNAITYYASGGAIIRLDRLSAFYVM